MIKEGEIIFKNPKIEKMMENHNKNAPFWRSEDKAVRGAFIRSQSTMQCAEHIISGYWYSMFECMMTSFEYTQWFDFSYDTLENLPLTLIRLYDWQKNTYSPEKNKEIIGKTIAAALYGLAINEHNCKLSVRELPDKRMIGGLLDWGGNLSIQTGIKKKADFRLAGISAVINPPIEVDGGMFIHMAPVIQTYKDVIGIDLVKYGVKDIVVAG